MAKNPELPATGTGTRASHQLAAVIAADLAILAIYVWFISLGSWTQWPAVTAYYDQLAVAFAHGHTWLDAAPDPALLALPNPYNPAQRQGIPYPLDASLYQGRFYLYFGPAPALLVIAARFFWRGVIGDQVLAFVFIYGIAVIESGLVLKICRRFFPSLSSGLIAASVLALGLIGPFTWSLVTPDIYNAALMAGQCFFLLGFYTAFDAVAGQPPRWKLLLTGLFWTAAVASRITQVLPVGLMVMLISARMVLPSRTDRSKTERLRSLLPLYVPLVVGAVALGWYDWTRFGSVFETGYKYALTGKVPMQGPHAAVFSPAYVVQNLYNYLLFPPRLRPAFPYFRQAVGLTTSVIPSIPLPRLYGAQQITGLLCSAPFVFFAAVPASGLLRRFSSVRLETGSHDSLHWLTIALLLSALVPFAVLLAYFWVAERFIADFLPALMLLSIIGFWQLGRWLPGSWYRRLLYIVVAVALMGSSMIISTLLAVSMNSDAFRQLNPVLWRQLSNLFRP